MESCEKLIFELKEQLENKYELLVDKIEKNDKSTDGNVFITSSQNEKYVIKIYEDINHVNAMTSLHSHLISAGVNVPKVIFTIENEMHITLSNGRYVVVYSFMKGEQLVWNKEKKIDDFLIGPIAKFLRSFHLVTSEGNNYGLRELPFNNENYIERCSALHFDLTKSNIFVNKDMDNEIGFIDLDDARYGPSVCDVAIAVAILFFSKTNGIDLSGAKKFIDEYYGNETDLKNSEIPLIKDFALKWIGYILDGNEFDTSTTESFEVRRQLIEENLFI